MAANLRKYKYAGSSGARPEASGQCDSGYANRPATPTGKPQDKSVDTDAIETGIISSLRADISLVIKEQLKKGSSRKF